MATKKFETEIDGYEVELEITEGHEPPTQCFIGKSRGRKGNWTHSASLSALEATGYLSPCNSAGHDHVVSEHTIDRIVEWAEENGY